MYKQLERGVEPEALRNRPVLPWYYETFVKHFKVLSFSRTTDMGQPNPIDIPTILSYNEKVAKVENYSAFLGIIQLLDSLYLKKVQAKLDQKEKVNGVNM